MTSPQHSLALVTGTSSGIGAALAADLLDRGWRVVGIARREGSFVRDGYTHVRVDVADSAALAACLETTLRPRLAAPALKRVGLVNNAANVALVGTVARLDPAVLRGIYEVNVAAPIQLMGWFLREVRSDLSLRIVNVSTGAASRPIPGMCAYASSKAALRMAGMIAAAELESAARPAVGGRDASILSLEPGIVDTPMQTAARSSSVETFPDVQRFKDWAAAGALIPPAMPARRIADYLCSDGHPPWSEERFEPPRDDSKPSGSQRA